MQEQYLLQSPAISQVLRAAKISSSLPERGLLVTVGTRMSGSKRAAGMHLKMRGQQDDYKMVLRCLEDVCLKTNVQRSKKKFFTVF